MALHVFAATSGNFWEAPRAAIAVKKNVPLEWMELSQLSLYMALDDRWAPANEITVCALAPPTTGEPGNPNIVYA